jgi:hypothetical protein
MLEEAGSPLVGRASVACFGGFKCGDPEEAQGGLMEAHATRKAVFDRLAWAAHIPRTLEWETPLYVPLAFCKNVRRIAGKG